MPGGTTLTTSPTAVQKDHFSFVSDETSLPHCGEDPVLSEHHIDVMDTDLENVPFLVGAPEWVLTPKDGDFYEHEARRQSRAFFPNHDHMEGPHEKHVSTTPYVLKTPGGIAGLKGAPRHTRQEFHGNRHKVGDTDPHFDQHCFSSRGLQGLSDRPQAEAGVRVLKHETVDKTWQHPWSTSETIPLLEIIPIMPENAVFLLADPKVETKIAGAVTTSVDSVQVNVEAEGDHISTSAQPEIPTSFDGNQDDLFGNRNALTETTVTDAPKVTQLVEPFVTNTIVLSFDENRLETRCMTEEECSGRVFDTLQPLPDKTLSIQV